MKKMMLAAMVGLGLLGMRAEAQAASGAALSARAYVQDGLVGMLDGIENAGWGVHNASATSWKDLAGTIGDFEINPACGAFQADGLKKTVASSRSDDFRGLLAKCSSRPTVADRPNNIATIEASMSGMNNPGAINGYLLPVFMGGNQFMAFYTTAPGTSKIVFDSVGNGNAWNTTVLPDALTCSVTYEPQVKRKEFYFDAGSLAGYAVSDNYGDNVGDPCAIKLGGRELTYGSLEHSCYGFTINAIRFYTRELTLDEIKQNTVVDAYRYRGTVPFDTAKYKAANAERTELLCRVQAKGTKGIKVTVNGEKAGEKWFKAGEVITLTATPYAGATFKGWKGTVEGYDAEDLKSLSIAVTVDRALDLIADGEVNSDILQGDDVSPLSAKAYVQDGLVGFLDGFENAGWNKHSAAATSWKDLAGTIGDFAVNSACSELQANGLKKVKASTSTGDDFHGLMATCTSRPSVDDRPNNIYTIEAAITGMNEPTIVGQYLLPVFMGNGQYMAFYTKTDGNCEMVFDNKWAHTDNGLLTPALADAITCSVAYTPLTRYNELYINAVKPTGSNFGDNYGDDVDSPCAIKLGGREMKGNGREHYGYGFTLNSIRFYTRTLSEAEVRQNYLVDAYRYRGEIPFDTADYKAANEARTELLCRVQATGTAGVKVLFGDEANSAKWVEVGDIVTLTASPYNGVTFTGWTGDIDMIVEGDASSATITVYVSRALSLTAEGIDESGIFPATGVSPLSAKAYVQDGLAGFLDGFENAGWNKHDADATSWKDLAGTIGDFAVSSCSAFQADGLKKLSTGVMATNGSGANKPNNLRTIETAVSGANAVLPDTTYYVVPVFIDRQQYIAFNWNGSTRQMSFDSNSPNNGWKTSETPDAMTYSVAYAPLSKVNGFYINAAHPTGELFSDTYGDDGVSAIKLGGRELSYTAKDNSACNYTLNAVRFYTRELSEAEVKQNYLIDAYRYRGEVPFDTTNYKALDAGKTELGCRIRAVGSAGVEVSFDGAEASEKWLKLGDFVTLKAKTYSGIKFTGWTGDVDTIVEGDAASEEITVFVNRALSLRATGLDESGKLPTEGVSLLSAKAYVQNGLVGLLDGFENAGWNKHDESVTSWKDIAGTIGDFAVNPLCGAFMADGLKKTVASSRGDDFSGLLAKCSSRPTVADRPNNIATIEASMSGMNNPGAINGYLLPVFMGGNQFMAFFTTAPGTSKIVFDSVGNGNAWNTTVLPDALTCSVTYEPQVKRKEFYFDAGSLAGYAVSDNYSDNVGDPCAIKLGGRELTYGSLEHSCYGFTINALRFYTSELTLDEIKNNTVVDAYRYRGEIPFDTENYKAANAERTELLCRVQATGVAGIMVDVGGETGAKWSALGKFVTLKANVPNGTTFTGWTGDTDMIMEGSAASETITVYVNRALSLVANGEHSVATIEENLELTEDLCCKGLVFGGAYRITSANGAKVIIDEGGSGIVVSGSGEAVVNCPIVIGETGAKQAIAVADGAKLVINGAVGGDAALDLSGDVQFLGGGDAKGDWNLLSGSLTLSGVFTDKTGTITATPAAPLMLKGADVSKLVALSGNSKEIPATTAADTEAQKANFLRGGVRDNGPSWMSWYLQVADNTELTIEGAISSAASITSYMAITGGGTLRLGVDTLASFCPTFYVARIEFLKAPTSYSVMRDAVLSKNMRLVAGCENAFALTSWEAKGIIDLNGMNQTMGRFAYPCEYNGDGAISAFTSLSAKVHSDEPATLTLAFDNATGSGSNTGKGVFGGQFTGKASFVKTGDQDLGLAGESTAVGSLTVAEGLVEFVKDLAYGGSAYTGSWRSCKVATVKAGGVLALDHSEAFGAGTRLVVENGGKVRLAAGVRQRVRSLTLPTGKAKFGTYGSPTSSADNKLDCFEGEGVVEILGGTMMFVK